VISGQVALLPDMEKADVYQALQNGAIGVQPVPSGITTYNDLPYLGFAVCPSDSTVAGKGSPTTSYVANSGMLDKYVSSTGVMVAMKPTTDLESAANGLFHDKILGGVKVSLTDIKDGSSTTLMLSENVEANWYNDSPVVLLTANNSNVDTANNCSERGTGFIWWDNASYASSPPGTAAPNTVARINGSPTGGSVGDYDPSRAGWPPGPADMSINPPPSNTNYAARPSSSHAGGANVAFAGANVKFLREDIDYTVYCLLMTPNGAKATFVNTSNINWQKNYPLNDASY
jgi:prepilin-type processing-associated H-X9-DG protein